MKRLVAFIPLLHYLAITQMHALLLRAAGWSEDRLKNEHWAAQVLAGSVNAIALP